MESEKQIEKKNWWLEGVALVGDVSGWIVGPVVVAAFFGKMLDRHYGTKPVLFLVCVGLAFLASIYGIWKIVRNYNNKLKK